MITQIKRKIATWALRTVGADPSMFAAMTHFGGVVEVTVRDERVWVNIDGKCQFRATATKHVVIDDGLEDDLAVRISRKA